jgi:predicted transcriptional regulator
MKIKEIMTKDVTSITPDTGAKEALDLLFKMQISGLPVIDTQGKLVGMFTEKEVLSHILPSYIERVGRFVYEENPKATRKKFKDLKDLPVSKLMRKEVVTVNEDASLCEVTRLMLIQKVRRILVLNKEKKVVGIVAREDILREYTREAGWAID